MPVYLIRHAHAGSRAQWSGDDDERPLSRKGRNQASALTERLGSEPIGRIVSSPAQRCVETVEELGRTIGVPVDVDRAFSEGSDPDEALRLVLTMAADNPAISTHGDLVPQIIRRLTSLGMRTRDPNVSQKGSVWILEIDGGSVVRGTYVPPG